MKYGSFREYRWGVTEFRNGTLSLNYQPLWVPWDRGFITEVDCRDCDVMSVPFTGCYFVKYRKDGRDYVGHIGTYEPGSDQTLRVKEVWTAFAARNDVQIICGFSPAFGCTAPDLQEKNEIDIRIGTAYY